MNADKWTDEQLLKIEREINSIYTKANEELLEKSKKHFEQFRKDDEKYKAMVDSGEMSKSSYYRWRKDTLTKGNQYKDLQKQTAFEITRANERATAYVNGRLPSVYVQNYNAIKSDVDGIGGYSFTLTNEDAVKYVYQNIDKNLLPIKKVDTAKDVAWNMKRINSEVLQGILQGESMDKVAGRLQNAGMSSEKAAIRNARTMVTGAQNHGKLDSYYRLKDDGIDIKKRWDATLDKRTREEHAELDGQSVDIDEPFENSIGKIMYPGDPDADPANVYNCRCSLQGDVGQTRGEQRATRDENGKSVLTEDMTYEEWYEARTGKKFYVEEQAEQIATTTESLRNAYEYHRTSNNLTSVSVDKLPEGFIGANYGNMSQETIEAFDKTFEDLTAKYDTPLTQVRLMDKTEFAAKANSFAITRHGYETDTAMIAINPAKCGDHEKMVDRLKELMSSGYAVQVDEAMIDRYIPTHEFAHSIVDMVTPLNKNRNWVGADYDKLKLARKEIDSVFESYIKDIGTIESARKEFELQAIMGDAEAWEKAKNLADAVKEARISQYSMLNSDEFLAEAFTQKQIGVGSNKYADRVMTIIDRLFTRK